MAVTDIAPERVPRRRPVWRQFLRQPSGVIALMIVAILVAAGGLADLLVPHDPTRMAAGRPLTPPSRAYPMGTDELGRDVFSRIMFGARLTLQIGAIAVGISLVVGLVVGMVAAFVGGWLESVLMRSVDVVFSFTETLIALAFVAVFGPSLTNAMIAVGIAGIPHLRAHGLCRSPVRKFQAVVRGRNRGGRQPCVAGVPAPVAQCHAHDDRRGYTGAVECDPCGGVVVSGAGGAATAAGTGLHAVSGAGFHVSGPWLMLFLGQAIALTVLAFNLAGDSLREATDPRSEGRA